MKKILSLVLALAMMLSLCSFAAAEEPVHLVWFIFTDTVAHRLLLTRQAEQEQKTGRDICTAILQKTPAPRVK